jgi:hypothetical protein
LFLLLSETREGDSGRKIVVKKKFNASTESVKANKGIGRRIRISSDSSISML